MEEFQVRLEQIGGCGDGGCMIHVRPGMHTNGGCRCSTDPLKMRQTVHAYKGAVAEQAQEIERLREALRPFADLGVGSGPDYEHDTQPYRITRGAIRKARAALQPKEGEK